MVAPVPPPSHTPTSHTPDLAPFRRVSLFRDLDEDVLTRVAALARHRTWRGVEFIDGPSSHPSVLIVGSGSLRLYRAAPTGDEVTLGIIGAGDVILVAATVGGEPSRTLYVANADRSPFVLDSRLPDRIRHLIIFKPTGIANELQRYGDVIHDPITPARGLEIITNEPRAVAFFLDAMRAFHIPGRVVVRH